MEVRMEMDAGATEGTDMDAGATEGTDIDMESWVHESDATTRKRMRALVDEVKAKAPDGLALASFAGLTFGAAALGSIANRKSLGLWYKTLRKPPFQPPPWLFAPVWTALYGLIATSGYRVWKAPHSKERTRALALWGTQLALNTAWSPLFFGMRKKRAALVDLVALLGAVGAYAETTRKVDKPAAAMMAPYLAWLAFAGVLNEEIVRRNRGWRRWIGR